MFAIGASENWAITFHVFFRSSTGGDIKFGVTVPSGAAGSLSGVGPAVGMTDVDDTNVHIGTLTETDFSNTMSFGGEEAGKYCYVQLNILVINSTNSGNVQLQWAQNGSDGTATTVYANSYGVAQKQA